MHYSKQPAELAVLALLALLLLCNGIGNVQCTVHENNLDLHSLLDFKHGITKDPNRALSSWDISTHFCRWNGVNCTLTRPFRVMELNLTGLSLAGQISSSIGNLTFLDMLDLSDNSFYGPFNLLNPLQHLKYLSLSNNLLEGIIPDGLTNCSNLNYLDLSSNRLTGVIPPSIGFLSKLEILNLLQNNLTGIIPSTVGNITSLQDVALSYNMLNGKIPDELWQMKNIYGLYLSFNNLSGGISQTLSNMSSLYVLDMASNMVGGLLPSNIGDAFPNLVVLLLGQNGFQGHIPASLGNATMLQKIDLSINIFSGQIPTSLGKLSMMYFLNLENNKLEASDSEGWEFLNALGNCSLLETLSLASNQLQGVIPNTIANLSTNLTRLLMSRNKLSGKVPPSIGKLHSLIQLSLDFNNLTGTIEEWVGNLVKLQHLNLDENNFIGTIPPSVSNFTQLVMFALSKNDFTGFILPSLGNLEHLLQLDLSYNNLQGSIPVQFGNLEQLIELDLSSNKLSGEIPETLGQCQNLVTIQMSQNTLIGNIPTSFIILMNLMLLNLSHNNLSGPLPDSLNDLKLLIKLDLSYNNFQGEIPRNGIFANATVVSLDGNSGLCGGTMEMHMQQCDTVYQRAGRVNYLVKILISIFGFLSLVMFIYIIIFLGKKTPRTYLLLLSFGRRFPRVSYKDIARATGNFSELNLIGRGSYGIVYRGKLTQAKTEVAIKVFDLQMRCADISFVTECEVLRSIRHRSLLPILTACATIDNGGDAFKALIYEFMPNGSLDRWLHNCSLYLSFAQRVSIAVDIADALAYLHYDCERPVVHCDLKPTNILLDADMNAYLGDFGIASFLLDSGFASVGQSSSSKSLKLKGTIGYIAPEYAQSGQALVCGDVYSFGIVLLEMLISKRPTDSMFENEVNIVNFVDRNYPGQVLLIIDTPLHEECKGYIQATMETENVFYRCLISLVQVALSCTRPTPRDRINMREVATKLHAIRALYLGASKRELVLTQ